MKKPKYNIRLHQVNQEWVASWKVEGNKYITSKSPSVQVAIIGIVTKMIRGLDVAAASANPQVSNGLRILLPQIKALADTLSLECQKALTQLEEALP